MRFSRLLPLQSASSTHHTELATSPPHSTLHTTPRPTARPATTYPRSEWKQWASGENHRRAAPPVLSRAPARRHTYGWNGNSGDRAGHMSWSRMAARLVLFFFLPLINDEQQSTSRAEGDDGRAQRPNRTPGTVARASTEGPYGWAKLIPTRTAHASAWAAHPSHAHPLRWDGVGRR